MKINRLHVRDFAAIEDADIQFGPGLNVLYGHNDLGKSTLADAIRLALLLPHNSTHIEEYQPWTGGRDPVIELTFETAPQRIWRVRKEFRRGGTALLQESKDGVDFDDVERARRVDAKLRELLRWGIPEPGGAGGAKGLPTSFLATVLLSTQSEVTAVLDNSLQGDPTNTGRERIAAALEAVAQDPLFTLLLRQTQARRDEAYTDKGAKKTARGSVFKAAADRLNDARQEKERLQKVVDDSVGVEEHLRELTSKRGQRQEALATAIERRITVERLAAEAAYLRAAAAEVDLARQEVLRIQAIGAEVDTAERAVEDLGRRAEVAEESVRIAQVQHAEANAAFESARAAARAAQSNSGAADTVARQQLELRKAAADRASVDAQQQIGAAAEAQRLVDAAVAADREHRAQQTQAQNARAALNDAAANERSAGERLGRIDLLERALDARSADKQVSAARAEVDRLAALEARREAGVRERTALQERRAAIVVPATDALGQMRRLAQDLAGARGALNVGLVVTVTPHRPIDIRVNKDGTAMTPPSSGEAWEVEANAAVDIEISELASVRIRGGKREAQHTVQELEARWAREVAPHLEAAHVADLDGLSAKITQAQELDTNIVAKDAELQSLREQIAALADSPEKLREALDRANACRLALGDAPLEALVSDLEKLGPEPTDVLRKRRNDASRDLEQARGATIHATTADTLAQERTRNSEAALKASIDARDAALTAFPQGVDAARSAAQAAVLAALLEQETVESELASFDSTIAARNDAFDAALGDARTAAEQARAGVDAANAVRTDAITARALQVGRLEQLKKQRDIEDLAAAEDKLRIATQRHAALPVPDPDVTEAKVAAAQSAEAAARSDLDATQRDIERTQGALEQVGGAVARERLRDAIEAYELAERSEREIEADYEAWLLLLDQMKQADAAQASHLGQTLAPAISGRFEALTQQRYENIQLTAHLGTEGVVTAGAVRPTRRISVGTREQLSTLYRLSLAEYLCTTVVLDDQLVQSDVTRMDWFRALLAEKAHSFQIVVFTCRPGDYLAANAMVSKGKGANKDTDGGFVRAVDLGRALRRG